MSIFTIFKQLEDKSSSDADQGIYLCGFVDKADLELLKAFDLMLSALDGLLEHSEIPDDAWARANEAVAAARGPVLPISAEATAEPRLESNQHPHAFYNIAALYRDLRAMGFGGEDDINGADLVELIGLRMPGLSQDVTRFQAISEVMASAKNVVLCRAQRNLGAAVQDLQLHLEAAGVDCLA